MVYSDVMIYRFNSLYNAYNKNFIAHFYILDPFLQEFFLICMIHLAMGINAQFYYVSSC